MNRREFLCGAGASCAGLVLPGCRSPFGEGPRARLALQTYSIGPYVQSVGRARAFAEVAAIGYRGVECGCSGDARELRKMLDDNGLVAVSTHVGGPKKNPDDALKAKAEFNCTIGSRLLISPGGTKPEELDLEQKDYPWRDGYDEHIKRLVDFYVHASEILRPYGLRIGLHNHQWEFKLKDRDGVTFWDRFFDAAPSEICMQIDVGWATAAGADPTACYRRHPHRSPNLHAKENKSPTVDWDALLPVTEEDGVGWYVVECEEGRDSLSAVTASYAFLKSKGLR